MKKLMPIIFLILICSVACEPAKEIKVEGNWEFSELIQGKAELNNQNKAMIKSITSLFKDGEISFKEGNVTIKSPVAGNRTGTYTVKNGIIDMEFGENSQVSLHIKNDGENLAILFSEDGENETGKIILVKK
ncbi:MAG: hypothetical protein CMD20_05145 [Flavobacteriales bacterium]|nr:hypothetical protein [Flavobacteriales bacterium]